MKISKLYLKNIYGIKEMALKPGDITILEGENEVGKTSLLDAIQTLFTNQGVRTRVIHNNETEAELFAELDEGIQVDRKIRSEKSDYIKISQGKDVIGSPESYLKSLFSATQFNPIKDFVELSPKEQKKVLLSLCNINFTEEDYIKNFGEIPQDYDPDRHVLENLEAIQAKSGHYYLTRETLNRERRAKENVRDDIASLLPKDYDAEQWRNVVLSELYNKVTKAQTVNENIQKSDDYIQSVDDKKTAIDSKYDLKIKEEEEFSMFRLDKVKKEKELEKDNIRTDIQSLKDKIEDYKKLIVQAENDIKIKESNIENINESVIPLIESKIESEKSLKVDELNNLRKTELDAVGENMKVAESYLAANQRIDIEPLQEEAQNAEAMKEYIRQADQIEGYNSEILTLQDKADGLTRKIEMARELPGQLLQKAEMPVPGITIENGNLLIDDLPLDNLSDGRKMEIALEVAKAKAGELKIILIDGFEKLSKKRREHFLEKARDTGLQYFITRVTDDESLNIIEI